MRFLAEISGKPGTGEAKIRFTSGATSTDIKCAQFFMVMQDKEASIQDAKAYAKMGAMIQPDVDWKEINRIIATFEKMDEKTKT